ncbi:hypothetical protein Gogos_021900 [Gossypium gossypioides]|uniref:Uncharacterized protein n=1 Tax=Gossypium gossypioides TaxID=34282 RepID=A0A7J9CXN6_GOSGO|nr:hypothetical protein [Gossypium gossypioides]
MSALVDIWSDELAKLREKGQTLFSTGSTPTTAESGQVVRSLKKSSTESAGAFVNMIGFLFFMSDFLFMDFNYVCACGYMERRACQTLFSTGSTSTAAESEKKSSTELARAFVNRVTRVKIKSPVVLCSEDSISMLVECLGP